MSTVKKITDSIYYVGVNDHKIDLFENQYKVPNGMAYNSYVIMDDYIVVMDTVDQHFTKEWLANIKEVCGNKKPSFLVIQHMEPDHSANILNFLKEYPDCVIVGNDKTFNMMENFFQQSFEKKMVVADGDFLNSGHHELTFVFAPMVHWPEVMVSYDSADKVLFSADGFGKFGALDVNEDWADEARRYYIGIVGKYGMQVQKLLAKAATLDIKVICPLHGPVLDNNLGYYLNLYNTWSSYKTEKEGIAVFYTSVYGHTEKAVNYLVEQLKENNAPVVKVYDLARTDMALCVSEAFAYGKIILATTTYNSGIFPWMEDFLHRLVERNFQNKTIGLIENGSWAPMAAKVMKNILANSKNLTFIEPTVKIMSSMSDANKEEMNKLAATICDEYEARKEMKEANFDPKALFNIGYGLYVVTTNDGKKDNGIIVNTVSQLTDNPYRVCVNINKKNYSCSTVQTTKKLNVNCLSVEAPFDVFKQYGFQSGKDVDKFKDMNVLRSGNGLVVLPQYINAYMSLEVEQVVDLGTHLMFICSVTESKVMSSKETMTYTYYQKNVKPKPVEKKVGYVCKVCGYVYEGETLPDDYICPLCKHGAADFEKLN